MTVLAAVCTKMPEAKLAIIFLPMFTFTAANVRRCTCRTALAAPVRLLHHELILPLSLSLQALKVIVAMDTAGVVLGWRFFDHAAHLGGALFGV